ncbi:MAG: hypothetical protein NTW14_03370 [bacterium]|nr:hypothetical protein [bacterium]
MDIKAIAKISKGTKRKKREINLLQVAEGVKVLYDQYSSLSKISELVKLSPEMVREFLKILELDEKVKNLIKQDLIISVDICYRLSKLNKEDQFDLAKLIIENKLSSEDTRNIVKFKIDNHAIPINILVKRFIASKNRILYVLYLRVKESTLRQLRTSIESNKIDEILDKQFKVLIHTVDFESFELTDGVVILKLFKENLMKLRQFAKEHRTPLPKLAEYVANTYLERIRG